MTGIRVALRRRGRPLAFLAASGMAIAGIAGAGSAGADSAPAPPSFFYSTDATAIGVQVALQRNPDFSNLPDPFDAETPDSEAHLDSFGTSTADGHVANLNGLGGVAGLVCLAAPAGTCGQIPIGQLTGGLIPSFPPPDPIDAHATYPAAQSAKAPLLGTKAAQVSFDEGGFGLSAGASDATATQYAATTRAVAHSLDIAGVLSIGAVTTTTSQTATADALTTTSTAKLSDIDLGGKLLHIGSMISTTTVVSKPGKPATDTTSTELGDVKAAGLAATIDSSGVTISGKGLPSNVVGAAQKLVNQVFAAAGIKLSLANIKRGNDSSGHSVAVSGLKLTFDHTVTGTQPITIAPQGVPCPAALHNLPLDPCSGVSLSLDGAYHGVVALGQVGVVSLAQPAPGPGPTSFPTGQPTVAPGGGTTGPGSGPGAFPSTGPISSTGPGPQPSSPVIAPTQAAAVDQLKNVSHRLVWFFPLFALGALALIGRFRVPARLPDKK